MEFFLRSKVLNAKWIENKIGLEKYLDNPMLGSNPFSLLQSPAWSAYHVIIR